MESGDLSEKYLWRGFLVLVCHYVTFEKVYVAFCLLIVDKVF